jgi:hypothetical protein
MPEEWVPIRKLAERRGVTPDAIQKQLKRGRLPAPWRRQPDGRLEVLVDLDALPPPPAADSAPLLTAMEQRLADMQRVLDRVLAERDAERAWREHEREGRLADAQRHEQQLLDLSHRLAEASARAAAAEAELAALREHRAGPVPHGPPPAGERRPASLWGRLRPRPTEPAGEGT